MYASYPPSAVIYCALHCLQTTDKSFKDGARNNLLQRADMFILFKAFY